MATEQRKTRGELRAMFWHDFAGTIADNMVEVNWLGWGLLAVYTVGLVVAGLQTWVFEAYLPAAARSLSKTLQTGVSFCMGI